jgi:hypothetical protein
MNTVVKTVAACGLGALLASCAGSQPGSSPGAPADGTGVQAGQLACDVSAGVGMIVVERQTLSCTFTRADGLVERYTGNIDQYGVALGAVKEGYLSWTVLAATRDLPRGVLAGTYSGVGTNASAGVGIGANVLVGGGNGSLSLQPLSVQGQTGVNIAGGITSMTLTLAP